MVARTTTPELSIAEAKPAIVELDRARMRATVRAAGAGDVVDGFAHLHVRIGGRGRKARARQHGQVGPPVALGQVHGARYQSCAEAGGGMRLRS